ncbi:MAG: glycogen-binding domain-containing protein [Endomicrobia bacterium]|nr:glycogen-binding domain-containing protein [Endomicrobiia bacterium]
MEEIENLLSLFAEVKKSYISFSEFGQQEIYQIVNSLPEIKKQPLFNKQSMFHYKDVFRQPSIFIPNFLKYFLLPVVASIVCLIYVSNFIQKNFYFIETTFVLHQPNAKIVQIAGDFTKWEPVMLAKKNGVWELKVKLKPGEYRYIYIIDGKPYLDPNKDVYEDLFGNKNSVICI